MLFPIYIAQSQKRISQLQSERAPVAGQQRKVEAEVGPIKYIAALIYGDNPDQNVLEKAVRWVIILLVLVFDPLALVLILAADQTFAWHREDKDKKSGWRQVWQPITEDPWHDIDPLTDEQLTKIRQEANVNDVEATEKFFEDGKELAKTLDANDGQLELEQEKNTKLSRELEAVKATAENLKKKFVSFWSNLPRKK